MSFSLNFISCINRMLLLLKASICLAFTRLLLAFVCQHLVLQSNQNVFYRGLGLPLLQNVQVVNFSTVLVDAGNVDLVGEGNLQRFLGVVWSAEYFETVDSSVENSLNNSDDTL